MLEDFQATSIMVTTTTDMELGRFGCLVRFKRWGHIYRFVFVPLESEYPDKVSSFGGKRRSHEEQTKYQMGRKAVHFVKAILTATEDQEASLVGFMETDIVTRPGALPITVGELDIAGMMKSLPDSISSNPPLLPLLVDMGKS